MPTFDVAHIRQQGVDLIIIPLDSNFRFKTPHQQDEAVGQLQARATSAGLAGTVVPVWDSGGGRMAFRAPRPWHPFFRSLNLAVVATNINKSLSW
jgi:hypothetical protein